MRNDFYFHLRCAFWAEDCHKLKNLLEELTCQEKEDLSYVCLFDKEEDRLGGVSKLPLKSTRFLIANGGKNFVSVVSKVFNMEGKEKKEELQNYCRFLPQLKEEFVEHFKLEEEKLAKKNSTRNFFEEIRVAFWNDDLTTLEKIWYDLTVEDELKFDYLRLFDKYTGTVASLPQKPTQYLVENAGARFVPAMSHKFSMCCGSGELENYCHFLPSLVGVFGTHFNVWESKICQGGARKTLENVVTSDALLESGIAKFRKCMLSKQYGEANECLRFLTQHIECCKFFENSSQQ